MKPTDKASLTKDIVIMERDQDGLTESDWQEIASKNHLNEKEVTELRQAAKDYLIDSVEIEQKSLRKKLFDNGYTNNFVGKIHLTKTQAVEALSLRRNLSSITDPTAQESVRSSIHEAMTQILEN